MERDLSAGRGLEDVLRFVEMLHPRVAAGTKGKMDAAEDIQALRGERLKAKRSR